MSAHHHTHHHRHGRRGVHDHRHGHRGQPPAPRRQPVPPLHWFAEHAHIHLYDEDEESLVFPVEPGEDAEDDQ